LADNLKDLPGLVENQQVIVPLEQPIKRTGHLQILYGNIAPEGCVGKITGKEGLAYEGVARCFDREEDMLDALAKNPDSFKVIHPSFSSLPSTGWKLYGRLGRMNNVIWL
jgi:dihydroxy-acid dehydratase